MKDSTVGVKTAEVLRFNTYKSGDERINSKEYADRIKEGQNDVYHITGENIAVVSSSPFEENLRKKIVRSVTWLTPWMNMPCTSSRNPTGRS